MKKKQNEKINNNKYVWHIRNGGDETTNQLERDYQILHNNQKIDANIFQCIKGETPKREHPNSHTEVKTNIFIKCLDKTQNTAKCTSSYSERGARRSAFAFFMDFFLGRSVSSVGLGTAMAPSAKVNSMWQGQLW